MAEHAHGASEHREESMATNTIVFILLLVLLALTFGAYKLDLGSLNLPLALLIACIKGLMVLMVFMHVRLSDKMVWVFSLSAFFWLIIMICGFENDYMSRPLDAANSHTQLSTEAATMAFQQ
jgi:cytochrome c oxidase subunit IV